MIERKLEWENLGNRQKLCKTTNNFNLELGCHNILWNIQNDGTNEVNYKRCIKWQDVFDNDLWFKIEPNENENKPYIVWFIDGYHE